MSSRDRIDARGMAMQDAASRTFARRALAVHAAASLALAVVALGLIAWRSAPSLREGSPQEAFSALGGGGGTKGPSPAFYGLLWPFSGQLDAQPDTSECDSGQR